MSHASSTPVPTTPPTSTELQEDLRAVVDSLMSGKPLDPGVARRILERGERITEELRQKYGELDIGVPAVRELRGELPE